MFALILQLLTMAPQYITQIEALYEAAKGDLSSTDQATIDKALADIRAKMPADQAATDAALKPAEGS